VYLCQQGSEYIPSSEPTDSKPGSRIKISPKKLKADILPSLPFGAQHTLIRALLPNTTSPIAHVFATSYLHQKRPVLWLTQLVVHSSHRNQGIAKALLTKLKEAYEHEGPVVGALSSNPFTIAAVLRVFGQGIEEADEVLATTRRHAKEVH
jgi:GNAT superfamily N-acetyltransferase